MTESLCERYHALTPFTVRREKIGEVLLLLRRVTQKNERQKGVKGGDIVTRKANGDIHIRREAKNDDWW